MGRDFQIQRWIYVSESLLSASDAAAQIADIMKLSRVRNSNLNVTGALIYTGERFAQLLEGPIDGVFSLKESISADSRHRAVTTIEFGQVRHRQFGVWSLVYSGGSRYMSDLLAKVELGKPTQTRLVKNVILSIFWEFGDGPSGS